jgi:hypothetical protein
VAALCLSLARTTLRFELSAGFRLLTIAPGLVLNGISKFTERDLESGSAIEVYVPSQQDIATASTLSTSA